MKTKRKSIILTIALCLLLALTSLLTVPFSRAKAEVKVADLVTGGTAYEPVEETVTKGTITLGSINITGDTDVNNNKIAAYTATGALLTATDNRSSTFNLGTYDMSTLTAQVPLIEILPWQQMKVGSTAKPNAGYNNFKITFTSGEKSFSFKSYNATDTGELGIGVAGENQTYLGWSPFTDSGVNANIGESNKTSLLPRRLDGSGSSTNVRSFLLDEDGGTINHFNSKRHIAPPVGYYIDPQEESFWVYSDVTCTGNYANLGVKPDKYDNIGQVLLGETGSQYTRFKVRDLKASVLNDSAWTPFTTDELKTVTVTVDLEGVESESKFLVTKINGQAITSVEGMNIGADKATFDGIALNVEDGVARTITEENKTLTVANKLMLADNDVYAPLAKIALFPKEYGSEGAATVDVNNYTQATDAGFGNYSNGKFWKTATSEADFNNAVATNDAKNKRDIDALYLNFTTESGKYASVKLAFRPVNDSGSMVTSYQARVNEAEQYKALFVTGGRYDVSKATAPASAIRFDGFVASGDEYDEKGVQMNTKGAKQDPVYTVYYNAEDNTLYADSGRIRHNTQTNFGTDGDPLYRWKIIDFDDFDFAGFGNELVTMTVTADLRDKDGDADLTDESAHIMLMNVDGYDVKYKLDGSIDPTGAVSKPVGFKNEKVVFSATSPSVEVALNTEIQSYNLFDGWTTYTGWTATVTAPNGDPVTVTDNKFTATKVGDYQVTYKNGSDVIGSYTVNVGLGTTTSALVSNFEKTGTKESDVKDLYYDALPEWMNFSGGGIMVETRSATSTSASGHYYTWEARGEDGNGAIFTQPVNISGLKYNSASSYDSLIKLAFPSIDEDHKYFLGAITYRINVYEASTYGTKNAKYFSIFIVPNYNGANMKAIGSWEDERVFANGVRRATWNNNDGSLFVPVKDSKGEDPAWNTGKKVGSFNGTGNDSAPIEFSFDYLTGKLYAVYNGASILIRDFGSTSLNGNYFDGFANGEVVISVGVDMPNYRTSSATAKSGNNYTAPVEVAETAEFMRFAVMGIAGSDFTAVDGAIADKAILAYDVKASAKEDIVFDKIMFGSALGGMAPITSGKIAVSFGGSELLALQDYAPTLKVPAEQVKAGIYTLTYENSFGTFSTQFNVKPVLTKPTAFEHVTVTVDGVDTTALADKTAFNGKLNIAITPDPGYRLTAVTAGNSNILSSYDAVNGGSYVYTYVNGSDDDDVITIAVAVEPIVYNVHYIYSSEVSITGGDATFTVEKTTIDVPTVSFDDPNNDKYYVFDGWYADGVKVVDGGYIFPASDLTLIARFKEKEYTFTFDYNDASIASDVVIKYTRTSAESKLEEIGNVGEVQVPEFAPAGKYIAGWYMEEECTHAFDGSAYFTNFQNGNYATIKVYAKWADGKVVSFSDGVKAQTIVPGSKATEPADPVKEGHTFLGWYAGNTEYDFDQVVTDNVTLTAKWVVNTYTVYAVVNGVPTEIPNVPYGTKVSALTLPTLTEKANHTVAWSMGGDEIIKGDTVIVAVYTPSTVTVTFNTDGGNEIAPVTFAYGEAIVAPSDPVKEGYVFDGWYSGDTKYVFGSTATSDVTLTAKWTQVVEDNTPDVTPDDKKDGCGKEAIGLLAVVLSALGATLLMKKRG